MAPSTGHGMRAAGRSVEICSTMGNDGSVRRLPAVRAALDGVPDPVNGLLVYRGRGGGAGDRRPRQPKPAPSASAVSLPEPRAAPHLDLTGISPPDPVHAGNGMGPDHGIPAAAGERLRG